MNTETFPTNTDDTRIPDNLPTMTKYEKHTWTIGTFFFLIVIWYTLCHLPFFTNVVSNQSMTFFMFVVLLPGFVVIHRFIVRFPINIAENEIQISHKATAWTFYGMMTILFVLLFGFLIFGEPSVSRDTVLKFLIYTITIFMGIRFTLLAHLLRKERLTSAESPHPPCPINTALPEGEGM